MYSVLYTILGLTMILIYIQIIMLTDQLLDNAEQTNNLLYQNIKIMCYICAIIVASMIWYYCANL